MFGGNPSRVAILAFLIIVIYVLLGYFIPREESLYFLSLYASSWALTSVLLKRISIQMIFWLGIAFRFVFLIALPSLSQDFYRFIWDGLLLQNELNPYAFSPNELMADNALFNPSLKSELFSGMGELSAQHYSNYPPVNQLGFLFSVKWLPNHLLGDGCYYASLTYSS